MLVITPKIEFMKKLVITLFSLLIFGAANAQTASDLFKSGGVKISWLGLDFSHAKFVGDFYQFKEAGKISAADLRNKYFPDWNRIIINEQKKYDVNGMLNKDNVAYDIDMLMGLNAATGLDNIEGNNPPGYKQEDIKKFVSQYPLSGKSGIGVALVVESFNKGADEAIFHFVAINEATKEILVYERIVGSPRGFGVKNYWAGAIYDVIKQIRDDYYKTWKSKYVK